MRIKHVVLFYIKDTQIEQFKRKCYEQNLNFPIINDTKIYTDLYPDNSNYYKYIELFNEFNIKWEIRRIEKKYSYEELLSYEYLELGIDTYGLESFNDLNQDYDSCNSCPSCGSGKMQINSLKINKTKMKNRDIDHTFNFIYIISERLLNIFKEFEFTGYDIREVLHYSKKKIIENENVFYQLIPKHEMPKLAVPPTKLKKENYCEICNRSGIYEDSGKIDSGLYYRRSEIEKIKRCDFMKTWEWFGPVSIRTQPQPIILISSRVYKVLHEHKIKHISVEPVYFID